MARRLSLKPLKTKIEKWPWQVNLPAGISDTGKRARHFFRTKQEADTFARQQQVRLKNFGTNSATLTPGQLEEAALAFEQLKPVGITLNEAVSSFLRLRAERERSVTFKELFEQFVASKASMSNAYLRALKYTYPRFPGLHDRLVSDIQPGDIAAEMDGMTPAVKNAFLRNMRAVFNLGIKRDWLKTNPVEKLEFESVKREEVITLSPRDAAALMEATAPHSDLLPYHALGLFSGIRPFELERLRWEQIDLVERHIQVLPEVSKTGRRRIIEIEENLLEWLKHYASRGGNTVGSVTPPKNLRKRLREIRKAAGFDGWVQDVMRHSYASYWLAKNEDINRLTLFMGHESATMLWKHYHKASKRADAALYWNIRPADSASLKTEHISAA